MYRVSRHKSMQIGSHAVTLILEQNKLRVRLQCKVLSSSSILRYRLLYCIIYLLVIIDDFGDTLSVNERKMNQESMLF